MGLIKNLYRGYRWGPDFKQAQLLSFVIGEQVLQLNLPTTIYSGIEQPHQPIYAINDPDWFSKHAKQDRQHFYVHLVSKIWHYGNTIPLPIPGIDNSVGKINFTGAIKQLSTNGAFDTYDLTHLGQLEAYIRESHFWAKPEKGKGWRGSNTKLKQKCIEEYPPRGFAEPFDSLEAYIEWMINVHGYPSINPEVKDVGGKRFAFYVEGQGKSQTDRVYCLPIHKEYYLWLRFRHDLETASEKVRKAALVAEERILSEMSIGELLPEQRDVLEG
ncbi:hypothetical protein F9L16_24070 [Agarivorans sp. B2Z047]|uniref:hypothetical protein n=1 Tax=Agarivorans sp. B2Z047 TaxID=2652721 RepID=UPI00128CAF11|nr:hypothetical protein [Agarivorans sp. B2Z047]MPW32025.1 hypothetical protein [Agarivorans sp. B2Z047]UQN41966.1 hypothetical protein LQZ07_19660 [Agarivorans sp. B2Z047]UQN43685.1 hypothetical protein LQZ07_04200 [Agarivorans sp. B2Z047]